MLDPPLFVFSNAVLISSALRCVCSHGIATAADFDCFDTSINSPGVYNVRILIPSSSVVRRFLSGVPSNLQFNNSSDSASEGITAARS